MTVITYSSAAGRIEKKIQVLEDPSSSGNVPEPLPDSLGPRTTLDHFESQTLEQREVKGQRWTKEEDQKTEEVVAGGNLQRRRQTQGRRVGKERVKTGQTEEVWMENTNYPKGNDKNRREGKDQSKTSVLKILSAGETRGEIRQWEKMTMSGKHSPDFVRLFPLKNASKEGRNMETFLWIALLILSLCLNPASSQVRVALKSHFLFLIQRLRRSDC